MRRPRTPGAGIAGALNSLAGDALPITQAGPDKQRDRAAQLDRAADFLLALGWHLQAERLAHRAAAAGDGVVNAHPACQATPTKQRARATKRDIDDRRRALFDIARSTRPMTVRQVFYQATVRGIVEKSVAGYAKVQTDLVLMRRSGGLPYAWLADTTRWQRKPITYSGIDEALEHTAPLYRKTARTRRDALSLRQPRLRRTAADGGAGQ